MALTAAEITTLSRQIAKCPGFTTQSGQLLNVVLTELAQDYDFDVVNKTTTFNFAAGYNTLPADWLRSKQGGVFYTLDGVPYPMTEYSQAEYDQLVQTAGFNSYPAIFYVDMSAVGAGGQPKMYVWPPASGAYAVTARYVSNAAVIANAENSATVPWFPAQTYLIRRTAGELMLLTGDDRAQQFLGSDDNSTPLGAGVLLRNYLKMKDNPSGQVKTVTLDRKRFGASSFNNLPNTKQVGW